MRIFYFFFCKNRISHLSGKLAVEALEDVAIFYIEIFFEKSLVENHLL